METMLVDQEHIQSTCLITKMSHDINQDFSDYFYDGTFELNDITYDIVKLAETTKNKPIVMISMES